MRKIFGLAAVSLLLATVPLHAQSTPPLATVVTTCGTPPSTYTAGQNRPITQDVNGVQCSGSGSAGSTVTANQGTANAGTANSWWVQIYNSLVGVKGTDGATIAGPTNPLPNTAYDSHGTQSDFTSASLVTPTSQYPQGASPITGNSTGTTGAVVGTLAATSGKTTYICGFDVSAIGGTATIGPITVAGLIGSSAVYYLASTATGVTMARSFTPCIPASSTNTAITVTTTADGTASNVAVNSHGYQL